MPGWYRALMRRLPTVLLAACLIFGAGPASARRFHFAGPPAAYVPAPCPYGAPAYLPGALPACYPYAYGYGPTIVVPSPFAHAWDFGWRLRSGLPGFPPEDDRPRVHGYTLR